MNTFILVAQIIAILCQALGTYFISKLFAPDPSDVFSTGKVAYDENNQMKIILDDPKREIRIRNKKIYYEYGFKLLIFGILLSLVGLLPA